MRNTYDISNAIHKYLIGKADEEELSIVAEWLSENEHHKKIMTSFQNEEYWKKELKEHQQFDILAAYQRFRQAKLRLRRKKLFLRLAGAAVVTSIVLGASLALWQHKSTPEVTISASEIKPGSSKATLIMSSGMTMHLEDSTNLRLDENNTQINIQDGEVIYNQQKESVTSQPTPHPNTIYTPRGGEYKLTLSDGTRVWLNADTEISFPSIFTGKYREVKVSGEVFFEVSKNPQHPFIVKTDLSTVQVTGTSFNVRAYPNEVQRITLTEGKINVNYQGHISPLFPGEQWVLDKHGEHVRKVKASAISGWKNGNFVFEDVPLDAVFNDLERWYNIRTFFGNPNSKHIRFTGIFPRYSDFKQVLNIIELATCVHCVVNDKTVIIYQDNK